VPGYSQTPLAQKLGIREGATLTVIRPPLAYAEWLALARPASHHSPDGTRRPYWLLRPLKPGREAYKLPGAPAK